MWLRRSRGGREEAPDAGRTNKGERVESRCALFLVTPSPTLSPPCIVFSPPPRTDIDMADAASGSTERSVQVKLVLLGG